MSPRSAANSYDSWTRDELIARLAQLEQQTGATSTTPDPVPEPSRTSSFKAFQISSQPRRKIAIKFCYSGWEYNGLAIQKGPTPLPTVEEVLFRAFARAHLVDPAGGLEGCGWERCGRTDRGVSAAGQVVSLWVRSAIGEAHRTEETEPEMDANLPISPDTNPNDVSDHSDVMSGLAGSDSELDETPAPRSRPKSELRYIAILNRILPPTIRVFAWSPVSPEFSARFSCRYRHYKYFFCQDGLDISLMRNAAARLVGEHDFRNLCKLDPAKQMTHFRRNILSTNIDMETRIEGEDVYVLDLIGTSFLYHQVRHIMAVLLLVGTGLEPPSVVSSLLNVGPDQDPSLRREGDDPLEIVDCKPDYQMADALPLLLWDCAYANTDVQWPMPDDDNVHDRGANTDGCHSGPEFHHQLRAIRAPTLIHGVLGSQFLKAAERYHPLCRTGRTDRDTEIMKIPVGGGVFRRTAKYVPLLRRRRIDSYEVANERWRTKKEQKMENKGVEGAMVLNRGSFTT